MHPKVGKIDVNIYSGYILPCVVFQCACLSGKRSLVEYLLRKGWFMRMFVFSSALCYCTAELLVLWYGLPSVY